MEVVVGGGVVFYKHYQCQCNYWLDDVASSPSTRSVFPLDFFSFINCLIIIMFFFGGAGVVIPYCRLLWVLDTLWLYTCIYSRR